jgi:hypothetical protein
VIVTAREEELGETKNTVEGYGQAGKLNGCNKLQSLMQTRRRKHKNCITNN